MDDKFESIIKEIEKEGDYAKKFIKYFYSLNLDNIRSTEPSDYFYPALEGHLPAGERLGEIGIPYYSYVVGHLGILSFPPFTRFEISSGNMENTNLFLATFDKKGLDVKSHLFGTWETDLEDKPIDKRFDSKDLRQAIEFLERAEHAYKFLY